MQELGRPETSQHVAIKAVGRAVHLVSFALRHATECGVTLERLVELTGWEPELVSEAVARAPDPLRPPAPHFVARLAPAGLDPRAVAQAAASAEATARLQELTQRILTDVDAWVAYRPPTSSTCTSAWTANGAPGAMCRNCKGGH